MTKDRENGIKSAKKRSEGKVGWLKTGKMVYSQRRKEEETTRDDLIRGKQNKVNEKEKRKIREVTTGG